MSQSGKEDIMATKKTNTTSKTPGTKASKGGKPAKSSAPALREPGFFSDYGGYGNIVLDKPAKKPASSKKK